MATMNQTAEPVAAPQYEELLTDIWVGVLLSTALLSCICCMCSCLLLHKFQKWKHLVLHDNEDGPEMILEDAAISLSAETDSLPSYTIVSGLPSYDEALKQLEVAKINITNFSVKGNSHCPPPLVTSPSQVSLLNCIHSVVNEKKTDDR